MTSQRKPAFLRGGPSSYGMLVITVITFYTCYCIACTCHALRVCLVHGSPMLVMYTSVHSSPFCTVEK